MQRPKPKLTENKLLMLYAINLLGPVTNEQALRFFVENDYMDYIDLQLSLAELADGGLLLMSAEPLGRTYSLSGLGKDAVRFFQREVPASRLASVDERYPQWRETFVRESRVFADYDRGPAGDMVVRLAARENGVLLFEMNISVPGKNEAKAVCDRWQERSDEIYAQVMRLLLENEPQRKDREQDEK